ncbi:MAG: hypothetical protein QM729_21310 [Solirubrobacterales bacterium]
MFVLLKVKHPHDGNGNDVVGVFDDEYDAMKFYPALTWHKFGHRSERSCVSDGFLFVIVPAAYYPELPDPEKN